MRSKVLCFGLAMVGTISWVGTAAAVDYGDKGPVATTTTNLKAGFGGATGGKLVVPNAPGTYPLIVASHGFSATADNQVGWAEHFASHGFVVVAPTFPGGFSPDHVKNGQIVRTLVTDLDAADTPAKGKIDKTRIGLEGHSAGGLATTLAAAEVVPSATVLFDPVDNGGLGKAAYAKLCGPVLSFFAGPSTCNNNTGWFDFRTTSKGPTTSFRVKGSTHCDGENAARPLCGLTCGGAADGTRQKVYGRYATAFFLANLKGDSAAGATLASGALSADTAIGEVSVGGGPSCVPTGGDAGVVDAGSDAGTTADAGGTGDGGTVDGTGDAGGCACTSPGTPTRGHGLAAIALGLAAVALGRARRSR
jgi:dienelactone hydrolase